MPKHALELLKQAGAGLIQRGVASTFERVQFDSRQIGSGDAFLARKGENQDGHDFVLSAYEKGVRVFLTQKNPGLPDDATVFVAEDPLLVLQEAARLYRKTLRGKVIGITGSVGKTSAKDMLAALLGEKTFASSGNFNNLTGLPYSLLQAPEDSGWIVLEMGISTPAEMPRLAAMACPDIALITGIHTSHALNFSSREEHIQAKVAIASQMNQEGRLFAPEEELKLWRSFLNPHVQVVALKPEEEILKDFPELSAKREILGRGPFQTLTRVFQMALELGILPETAFGRIQGLRLSPLRMELREESGVKILLDCYNAAPESMRGFLASLPFFLKEAIRPVVVLADMLELGLYEKSAHEEILRKAADLKVPVFLLGPAFGVAFSGLSLPECRHFEDRAELRRALLREGADFLALKGSRGFALEKLLPLKDDECLA